MNQLVVQLVQQQLRIIYDSLNMSLIHPASGKNNFISRENLFFANLLY